MATTYPVNRTCPLSGSAPTRLLGHMRAGLVVAANPTYRPEALSVLGLDSDDRFPVMESPTGFAFSGWLPDAGFLKRAYDDAVDHSRTMTETPWYRQFLLELAARLLETRSETSQSLKVLDFGCGYAALLGMLACRDVQCVGYEPSAMRRARTANLEILSDLSDVAARGPFDLLICTEVLEHTPVPSEALRALKVNAAAGAFLLVTVPCCETAYLRQALDGFNAGRPHPPMFNPWEHLSYFRPADLRDLLAQEGFAVVADLGRARAARSALTAPDRPGLGNIIAAVRATKRLLSARPSTQLLCRVA
jgi:SAM-dependent methyltransferase